jgi:hypothetical protein
LNEEQRGAFEAALRYFREAAPKHTADEEESLFPRLRRIGAPTYRCCWRGLSPLKKSTFAPTGATMRWTAWASCG